MELKQKKDLRGVNPYAAPGTEYAPTQATGDLSDLVPAGHLERGMAFIIDTVIAYGLIFVMAFVVRFLEEIVGPGELADLLNGVYLVLAVGLPIGYHTLMEGSALQASVGKLALGLRVVHAQSGERLGYGRAFLRALVRGLLSMGWIFWLIVALSKKRQGLWDMIAKARVVKK